VIELFGGYPQAAMSRATVVGYWGRLCNLPQLAVEIAFRQAPEGSSDFCPSAERIREIADVHAKAMAILKPNYALPALPEPEPELDPSNPFFETLERYKRGEIPGKQVLGEFVDAVVRGAK